MTAEIVVATDLKGLYVNITRIPGRLQPNIEEVKHAALKGYSGTFQVQGGNALYQVSVIDLDEKYGGGQKWLEQYVPDGSVTVFSIETQVNQ
jgi:hypothetical protein